VILKNKVYQFSVLDVAMFQWTMFLSLIVSWLSLAELVWQFPRFSWTESVCIEMKYWETFIYEIICELLRELSISSYLNEDVGLHQSRVSAQEIKNNKRKRHCQEKIFTNHISSKEW
jgi:hypothetical protein